MAALIGIPYILLNVVVLGAGPGDHPAPEAFARWSEALRAQGD